MKKYNETKDDQLVSLTTYEIDKPEKSYDDLMVEYWDILENDLSVSEETLKIITDINGYNLDTLESVLYAVSGYKDFEQFKHEEIKNF